MQIEYLLVQSLINGLVVGMLYLLMAIGFTLAFGVMRIVNFAHGECYMLGAFAAYVCVTRLGMPFLAAIVLIAFAGVAFGWLIESAVLSPFRQDELSAMIVTLGLAMILQNLALLIFGAEPLFIPAIAEGVISVGSVVVPKARLYVVAISLVILVLLYGFLRHTKHGRALRATVQDAEIASAYGINPRIVYPLGFGLGVALAIVAGGLMAPIFSVSPFIGTGPMVKAFIVVILGGLGSIPGAAVASISLGLAESLGSTFFKTTSVDIGIFVAVMAVLVFRPDGLLGSAHK